jgi:ribonuclease P protein component
VIDQSFPKELRLTHKREIDNLFSKGSKIKSHPFIILYNKTETPLSVPFKLLISVPKRNFKKAVDRNYLKRCIREVIRKNKESLSSENKDTTLCVAILYSFKTKLPFNELESSLLKALKKIHQ